MRARGEARCRTPCRRAGSSENRRYSILGRGDGPVLGECHGPMLTLDEVVEVGVAVPVHLEDWLVGGQPERASDAVEDDAPAQLLEGGGAGVADGIRW
jgi:hypothetical protein